jgi:glycosyltransferase involved in cell wall biosynthesis
MSSFRRLRILLLTPQLPYPPEQGTSLRNYHILRGLARDHEVHLLSFDQPGSGPPPERTPLLELCAQVKTVPGPGRTLAQRVGRLVTDPRPDMAHRLQSKAFEQALLDLLRQIRFDVVQVEGIELVPTIQSIRQSQQECKIVFDDHNAEAELQRRMFVTDLSQPSRWPSAMYSFIQWRRLRRFERQACRIADGVSVVSRADRKHLLVLAPEIDPIVIPNCLDVEAYRHLRCGDAPTFEHDLLFIGKMDYRPNVDAVLWFSREIWPHIRARRPNTSWAVVGKQPHRRLLHLNDEPGISLTGAVPDIKPYLACARVYVMPFRIGSGTRLKLIEALASAVAMVSTQVGAEGYPLTHGEHLLLEDDPEAFALAVLNLLENDEQRQRLARAGQVFADSYDWRRVIPKFNRLYARLGLL